MFPDEFLCFSIIIFQTLFFAMPKHLRPSGPALIREKNHAHRCTQERSDDMREQRENREAERYAGRQTADRREKGED